MVIFAFFGHDAKGYLIGLLFGFLSFISRVVSSVWGEEDGLYCHGRYELKAMDYRYCILFLSDFFICCGYGGKIIYYVEQFLQIESLIGKMDLGPLMSSSYYRGGSVRPFA